MVKKHRIITAFCMRQSAMFFALLLVLTASLFGHAQMCFAQNEPAPSSTLTLENTTGSHYIGLYSYLTEDNESGDKISLETLVQRHKGNLKGTRLNSELINFKTIRNKTWILFNLHNVTDQTDWILHFGETLDGRMGIAQKIEFYNFETGKIIALPETNASNTQKKLLGSALSFNIMPGEQNTFILAITPQNGLPLIFAPKIMSQDAYMAKLQKGNAVHLIAAIFFASVLAFFASSFYITRHFTSLAIISYYSFICALFFNLDVNSVTSFSMNGTTLLLLYLLSFIPLFIATKFFNHITHDFRPMENMALSVLVIFMLISALAYITITGLSYSGFLVLVGCFSICLIMLCVIYVFTSERPFGITFCFFSALFIPLIGLILLSLISFEILPTNQLCIYVFWLLHIPQAVFFIASYLKSNQHRQKRKKQDALQQTHDEQSLSRLQKSKESADKARLLRVIERERELMSELREREVKRTEEMRKAKDTANKANKDKSAFLAVVSHEIRTPMNGILGMVQLMKNTELTKSQGEYIETIHKSGDTMMALLNDILDFEKIEKGAMELENVPFNIRQLVNDISMLMSGHAAQKKVQLISDIEDNVPAAVLGDPTRIRQILLNLVNNALKFTEIGYVKIGVRKGESDDSALVFYVEDTGIGISESAQEKLFQPFTQAETSTSRKYGGTGLGLAISNRLIEAMGGKIQLKSVQGEGSIFSFEVTLIAKNIDAQTEDHDKKTTEVQSAPMRLLIVEDNEMNRKVLEGLLSRHGHTIHMATNGLEAIDICIKTKPDLILMDIQMDGLSGVETTTKIRKIEDQDISRTPIIALTGNVMLEDIETFFETGMNGFLAKPINANDLYQTLFDASQGKFEHYLPEIEERTLDLQDMAVSLELDANEDFTSPEESNIAAPKTPQNSEDLVEQTLNSQQDPIVIKQEIPILKTQITPIKATTPSAAENTASVSSASDQDQVEKSSPPNNDELTEIQKYLLAQHSDPEHSLKQDTKDSPSITEKERNHNVAVQDWLDTGMLDTLKDSLGIDQFKGLLIGFTDTARDIINALDPLIDSGDITALGARGHELKGMAGNFGMNKISEIAGQVEQSAKTQRNDQAIIEAQKLKAAYENTQAAFDIWLKG